MDCSTMHLFWELTVPVAQCRSIEPLRTYSIKSRQEALPGLLPLTERTRGDQAGPPWIQELKR